MSKKHILLFMPCWLLYSFINIHAQKRTADSLVCLLAKDKQDTFRVKHYLVLGTAYRLAGGMKEAMSVADSATSLSTKLNYLRGIAEALNLKASVYYTQGDYPNALNSLMQAVKAYQGKHDKLGLASITGNMGLIYKQEGDYKQALDCYLKAYQVHVDVKDTVGIIAVNNNLAVLYELLKDTTNALLYLKQNMELYKKRRNDNGEAITIANLGNIYEDAHEYDKALEYYMEGLKMDINTGDNIAMGTSCNNIGYVYLDKNDYKNAEVYELKALEISKSTGNLDLLGRTEGNLGFIYSHTGRWKEALEAEKMATSIKDTLINQAKSKQIGKLEAKADYDKQLVLQQAEQDKKSALSQAENSRQNIIIFFVAAVALAAGIITLLIFRSLRVTREQKVLIEKQKTEVEIQKSVVEEKNKEITDSITYAKRLQDAILPSHSEIKKHLPEVFVLYQPKAIVAGDFYWMYTPSQLSPLGEGVSQSPFRGLGQESPTGEVTFIAAADCTGHGVPGAMVSVVCSNALNRAVKEFGIRDTGKILDKVNELVVNTYEKSSGKVKDGMDISISAITYGDKNIKLLWAGANNPLWVIPAGGGLLEVAPDKQPIGLSDDPKPFTTHELVLNKGDVFYLLTDGYAEQIGERDGQKFGDKRLQDKLVSLAKESMLKQGQMLEKQLDDWKSFSEQTDDICIIGVRV
jgi:serine phosphatase RsbU (regulator of sigma subunit)/Flp pilus assembly protein TadD